MDNKQLKQVIQREYLKCVEDPTHFMTKYCTIQHPKKGKVKFDLYPFQQRCVKEFTTNRYNVILKSRQLGLSTLSAGYALWTMLFNNDKNILVIATGKDVAKNLVTKVRVMYDNLPSWLKTSTEEINKLSLRFTNGSQIKAIASNESAGRSEALSLLIIDEAAFIDKVDTIWTSAQQTLATGGDAIVLSTPNGVGNWFHRQWVGAEDGTNEFNTIRLHWTDHPDRDQTWRNEQEKILGPSQAAQECDADFLTSGQSVVDPKILQWYKDELVESPVEELGMDKGLWIFRQPDYTKEYIVVADVARGDGSDYSACQVFEISDMEQVAEYKGQLSTTDYGNFLIELATKYNDALLVVENNNIGWATIQTIIDRQYKNLFYQSKDLKVVDIEHNINNKYRAQDKSMVPGFSTTLKTRPLIVAKMEEYTREKLVKLHSNRLLDELFVFIYKTGINNAKAEAMQGYNDDLVMSYSIALWVRDTALRLQKDRNTQQWSMMDSMLSTNGKSEAPVISTQGRHSNPEAFKWHGSGVDDEGNEEDLTWLIK